MAIKQTLSDHRARKVYFSLQKMAIMSKVLLLENQSYCDTEFRVPFINNFSKRIGNDCLTIQQHLEKSGKITVNARSNDNLEEYASEIWRVVSLLSGLELGIIKEFADNLETDFEKIGI